MSKKLTNFIKKLSEVYDPKSEDTYVSLYLNRDSNKKFIDKRTRACKSILKGDELNIFSATMKDIFKVLKKNMDYLTTLFKETAEELELEEKAEERIEHEIKPLMEKIDEIDQLLGELVICYL